MSWFPPPKVIETTVYARLPAERAVPRPSTWADANKPGATLGSFLEGPAFDRAGNLYVTDIPFGRVFRIAPDRRWTVIAEYDGWPNGLKIDRDGRLFIADYRRGLLELDPDSGAVTPVVATVRSESFKGINDLAITDGGDIYFTDQGQTGMQDWSGRVYRRSRDGRLERLLDNGPSPNGLVVDPEETLLYVALTRACQVWRVPISRDGVVGKANVFCQLPGGVSGPDGLAMDVEGGVLVCDPGHGTVWRLDAFGVPTHRIVSCGGRTVTNLAFGGADHQDLMITDSAEGQVLTARAPFPGRRLPSHT